ncbi:peptidylprolyl isomerase [Candidatus Poseidoniales archaeon]|nr:peptidylprolyl isomerase [Candidatus Poseidoniales archaeon]
MSIVEANAIATVHYTGTLPGSGEIFDSSEGRDPLSFLVGHKQMIPGFEEELMGAEKGERRTFTLEPERAYGQKMDEAIQTISKDMFGDIDPEVGMTLMSDVGPFNVTAVDGDIITVDFNHKLAGESLEFSVEVVDVRPASEEELSHGHAHGPGGHEH